ELVLEHALLRLHARDELVEVLGRRLLLVRPHHGARLRVHLQQGAAAGTGDVQGLGHVPILRRHGPPGKAEGGGGDVSSTPVASWRQLGPNLALSAAVVVVVLDGAGEPWEVLNVALPGWSTRQEAIAYRRIARGYAPDLVLLGVCLNDIPELQNNLARPPAWLAGLHRRSALVRRIVGAREREIADVDELFAHPDAAVVGEAFARLFAEVRALRAEVEGDGARLAVLLFPVAEQAEPGA